MNLSQAILEIYPNLDPSRDFEIRQDEAGKQYIHSWNNPSPRPTDVQLAAAWFRVAKRQKKAEGANRMHRENRALYPEVQEVEGAWVAELIVDIVTEPRGARVFSVKANRDKRARFYALIDGALTVDALNLLTWESA